MFIDKLRDIEDVVHIYRGNMYTGEVKWSEAAQSCPTLCNPMVYSPLGSSVHEILQARVLEWVAIPFSRGSSQPRDRTQVSRIAGRHFNLWATREALWWCMIYVFLWLTSLSIIICRSIQVAANGIIFLLWLSKNNIMPFAATCIDIQIIILSEVSQRKTYIMYHLTYEI